MMQPKFLKRYYGSLGVLLLMACLLPVQASSTSMVKKNPPTSTVRSLNPFFDYWEVDPQGEHFYAYRSQQGIDFYSFQKGIKLLATQGHQLPRWVVDYWCRKVGKKLPLDLKTLILGHLSAVTRQPLVISLETKSITLDYRGSMPLFCLDELYNCGKARDLHHNTPLKVDIKGNFAQFFSPYNEFELQATTILYVEPDAAIKLPGWKLVVAYRYSSVYIPSDTSTSRYVKSEDCPGHESFLKQRKKDVVPQGLLRHVIVTGYSKSVAKP